MLGLERMGSILGWLKHQHLKAHDQKTRNYLPGFPGQSIYPLITTAKKLQQENKHGYKSAIKNESAENGLSGGHIMTVAL